MIPSLALLLVGSIQAAATATRPALPDRLPRYDWSVGQELVYENTIDSRYEHGSQHLRIEDHLWCAQKTAGDGYRFVVREAWFNIPESGPAGANLKPMRSFLNYVDRRPDGSWSWPGQAPSFAMLTNVMPVLPAKLSQLAAGWEYRDESSNTSFQYSVADAGANPPHLAIKVAARSMMDEIYETSSENIAFFDCQRGLVDRVDIHSVSSAGAKSVSQQTIKLLETKKADDAVLKSLQHDTDEYFVVTKQVQKTLRAAMHENGKSEQRLDEAARELDEFAKRCSAEAVKSQIEFQRKELQDSRQYHLERAKASAELLGKAAPDWELKDLEDKPHALKDFRGHVLLLDFWYRGCGWCIRAMPDIESVSKHFKSRKFRVLGMNKDTKVEDARFVVDKLHLTSLTLQAETIPEQYKVQGFPTFIIVDQKGVIREIQVGCEPGLRDDLIATIEPLLTESER